MRPCPSYLLVTPCRNEERFARCTLDSVVAQSVPPRKWILVDDGSTDGTPEILAEYAAEHDWIEVVTLSDQGRRRVGPGVVEAFERGLERADLDRFEYLCKLDLDLILPLTYFERLIERMEADPRLGSCSGKPYFVGDDGELVSEGCGDETSIGASKFYRVECYREVGGFVREVMWDGIDCHRGRMLGWRYCSWDEPELRFTHLRPMGSSQHGLWRGRLRHGYGQWFMGTGPVFMAASALYRMTRPPRVVGGVGMFCGYVASALKGRPRYADAEFRAFLRRYHRECLLFGKRRATARAEKRREHVWHSLRPDRSSASAADRRAAPARSDEGVVEVASS